MNTDHSLVGDIKEFITMPRLHRAPEIGVPLRRRIFEIYAARERLENVFQIMTPEERMARFDLLREP
jgi:hypothetical protein